jgi:hypothetical protein
MLTTWIESPLRGRLGQPVRAGMWGTVVVGTHPEQAKDPQADGRHTVWLEATADGVDLGTLPAFWLENANGNSLWHVPVPPQVVNARVRYRAGASRDDAEPAYSPWNDIVVRANVPPHDLSPAFASQAPEGLVGNRLMTVLVDRRASTFDVYFPSVGLHSEVRPAHGDQPQSRVHFRTIAAGLALGRTVDWFCDPAAWDGSQSYQGATNVLVTRLGWRGGPVRVVATDLVAQGANLPSTAGGDPAHGQYLKRFRIVNEGHADRDGLTFALLVHTEINGGVGDTSLSWHEGPRLLLATNRGHGHTNRKLTRDATVEFAITMDDGVPVEWEPLGPNEAMLLRRLDLPAGGSVTIDVLVSGAFTGWRNDDGTFAHWIRPALDWFRAVDRDEVEREAEEAWDAFVEPLPVPVFPPNAYAYAGTLRRSALAAALHTDSAWGSVASAYDRGIRACCFPREAIAVGGVFDRLGVTAIGAQVLAWLRRVRNEHDPYLYWFQKYTMDGRPDWETPAVDNTALIPWALERHYRRTGDRSRVEAHWTLVEEAARVCAGDSGHPGLTLVEELNLVRSSGAADQRFGAFLQSNAAVVAGLRAASRLAEVVGREDSARAWRRLADRIWNEGILRIATEGGPGLMDPASGRFLEGRRVSSEPGQWAEHPGRVQDRCADLEVGMLALAVPFGLLPATDPRLRATAEAILARNAIPGEPNLLVRHSGDGAPAPDGEAPSGARLMVPSSLATLWMARHLLAAGKASGDAACWARAVGMLDAVIRRMGRLGLALRLPEAHRRGEELHGAGELAGVWDLHGMLIEALLDLTGLDVDVPAGRLTLEPILPPEWPVIGLDRRVPGGTAGYRLERGADGGSYRLQFEAELDAPLSLEVAITCPGLARLASWRGGPDASRPRLDGSRGRLEATVPLPAGRSAFDWSWS